MVAISMTRTSGQSIFNFVLRTLGSAIAMIGSYIIWYIVDGNTAGAIVFLWLWMYVLDTLFLPYNCVYLYSITSKVD